MLYIVKYVFVVYLGWMLGNIINRMKIDADKILESVKEQEEKAKGGAVTMYFRDKTLWKRFQEACKPLTASKVVEELLKQFLASKKKK